MTPADFLSLLLPPGASHIAAAFRKDDGGKYYMPSDIQDDADRLNLIRQQLSGDLQPRLCTSKRFGKRLRRDHHAYGVYMIQPDGTARAIVLDIDVKGDGHARGETEAKALAMRDTVCAALEALGLPYFIERSHGAKGWHVWVLFAEPQPAAFAHWLADRVASEVPRRNPEWAKPEAFPKQAKPRTLGSLVALPLPGKPKAPGGGRILWADGSERALETIERCPSDLLRPLIACWKDEEEAAELRRLLRPQRTFAAYAGQGLDLATIMELMAPEAITEDVDGELHCDCPRHASGSKRSLHVLPDQGFWICHSCADAGNTAAKGGGDAAAFTLVRWFLPETAQTADVYRKLEELEARHVRH